MKTYTIMTLSAAMIVLGSTYAAAQNLSLNAASTLNAFDKGSSLALKGTKLPFEKQAPDVVSFDADNTNTSVKWLSDDTHSSHAPIIDPYEEWGEWSSLGAAIYTRGSEKFLYPGCGYSFVVPIEMRTSTVAGHETLHQIKVVSAFGDNDIIFWWDSSDDLTECELSAEDISTTFTVDGYPSTFKSISIDNAFYKPAHGRFSFRVSYSTNDVGEPQNGVMFTETIVMRDLETYFLSIEPSKRVYSASENKASFEISASQNLKTIRYYVMPETDASFSGTTPTLTESQFIKLDYKSIDASQTSLDIDISGYQRYIVYFQAINKDNQPTYFWQREIYSTQEDQRSWTSIGYGTLADQDFQDFYVEEASAPFEWKVLVQQCDSDPSLYRLLNPYTNENSPYLNLELFEDYADVYSSYCDLSQNYYTYFRVDNNNPVKGTAVYSYQYPSGLYFQNIQTGELTPLCAQKFTSCSDDHKVASPYSSVTLPQFVDFSFDIVNAGNHIINVVPKSTGIILKYEITLPNGNEVIPLKDVPDNLVIDLRNEGLNKTDEFKLIVKSYNFDNEERVSKEYYFNLGMSDWELVGSGIYTYTTYYDTTCPHDIYRRHSLLDENHEQYKIDSWMFKANTNFIIDVPDKNAVNDDGQVMISVPEAYTKVIHPDYGEVRAADAFTYSGYDEFLGMNYYIPKLGEFHMYNVYYIDEENYFDVSYETFKIDGYPDVAVVDGGHTRTDNGYIQSFLIDMKNVDYVTYGVYDADEYSRDDAYAALIAGKNVTRITESTYLTFDKLGEYILVAAAHDASGEILKTGIGTFCNVNLLDKSAWTYLGQALFVDGWIIPGYTTESNQKYWWYIDAYTNNVNPNIVGLLNPYIDERCTLTGLNLNYNVESMLAIDITDPEFIVISQQYSGFKAEEYGDISIGNYEGTFIEYNSDKDEIISEMESLGLRMTTINDEGLITIPHSLVGYTGGQFGLSWQYPQVGFVLLPDGYSGVRDVIVNKENADAPVEYFNLLGERVNNPEHGIFIRRQGSSTTKVTR